MAIPNGAAASDALSSIGSDLSFAVSFAIANELLAAAREEQIADSELVAIVLLISVCVAALPKALLVISTEFQTFVAKLMGNSISAEERAKNVAKIPPNGLLSFLAFFLQICQRISLTVTIQLVTSSVQSSQPLRSVRLLSLFSVLFFFVFLRQSAAIGQPEK